MSIDVIELLRKGEARVRACDPVALETARSLLGDAIELCASRPYQVAEGSDALVLVTEWDEFRDRDLETKGAHVRAHPGGWPQPLPASAHG